MTDTDGSDVIYSAGQAGSAIKGDLDGLEDLPISDHARFVDDPILNRILSVVDSAFLEFGEDIAGTSDATETRLWQDIVREEGTASAASSLQSGRAARMQGYTGLTDHSKDVGEGLGAILNELRQPAFTAWIGGSQNVGKTDFGLYLAELWEKTVSGTIVTNIPVDRELAGVTHIREDSTVKLTEADENEVALADVHGYDAGDLALHVNNDRVALARTRVVVASRETHVRRVMAASPGRTLAVVDEWGTAGGGDKGYDQNAADLMLRFVRAIRKEPYLGSIVVVGHAATDANKDLRQLVDLAFGKSTKKRATAHRELTSSGPKDQVVELRDVPGTTLSYNDGRQPVFVFDAEPGEDDDGDESDEMPRAARIRQAQRLRDNYSTVVGGEMTLDDIAEAVDRSETWIKTETDPPGRETAAD